MKKNDYKLIAVVITLAVLFFAVNTFFIHGKGEAVTITVNGELFGTYPLAGTNEIDINGSNVLAIANGKADMTWADCPDKLCVHQKAINREKETIVCLPNKVVAEVTSGQENEFDSIVGKMVVYDEK